MTEHTPDPLADLIAEHHWRDGWYRCGRTCEWMPDDGDILGQHAAHVAAVIRAAQDNDTARLKRGARTLLPGLLVRNYAERWAHGSPAVQALNDLSIAVGDGPVIAGERQDPHVASVHETPPEARAALAAHHTTTPTREQIAKTVTRSFWDLIPDDAARKVIADAGYDAADAVLALFTPTEAGA